MIDCRFYRKKFPDMDELVMIKEIKLSEAGATVQLLKYNKIEGLIMLGELTKKRIQSVISRGRLPIKRVIMVTQVDETRGHLEMSSRQVTTENIAKDQLKYNKAKTVHNILRHVSQTTGKDLERLYDVIGWPLYDNMATH